MKLHFFMNYMFHQENESTQRLKSKSETCSILHYETLWKCVAKGLLEKEKKLYSLILFCRAPHSFKFSLPLFLVSDIYFTVPLFYLALKSSCRSRKSPVSSFERYLLKLEIHRFVLLFKFSPFLIMKYLKTFIIEMGPYPMYIYYFI